jgi:hypothetical protein
MLKGLLINCFATFSNGYRVGYVMFYTQGLRFVMHITAAVKSY